MAVPDVSGTWKAIQSNGFWTGFRIEQDGGQLSGSAHWLTVETDTFWVGDVAEASSMEASGSVNAEEFVFNVSWDNGTRGLYTGRFQGDGRLTGLTVDQQHPESQATWISDRQFVVPAPEPAPPEKPVRRLGKIPTRPKSLDDTRLGDLRMQDPVRLDPD